MRPSAGPARAAVLRCLQLDALALEVTAALGEVGVPAVLLKGRSLADRLYGGPGERPYGDVDLLVPPHRFGDASAVLAGLGFRDVMAGARTAERPAHADSWVRNDRLAVDLHRSVALADAPPAEVWEALAERRRPLALGAGEVDALDDVGLAVHAALHAAQHGRGDDRAVEDLSRAVIAFDEATWAAAGALAHRMGAAGAARAGLTLVPGGDKVVSGWTEGSRASPEVVVRASGVTVRGARSVAQMVSAPPTRRIRVVCRKVFPSAAVLRRTSRLARRGGPGLVAAYVARPFVVVGHLPGAVAAWRRASGAGSPPRL